MRNGCEESETKVCNAHSPSNSEKRSARGKKKKSTLINSQTTANIYRLVENVYFDKKVQTTTLTRKQTKNMDESTCNFWSAGRLCV